MIKKNATKAAPKLTLNKEILRQLDSLTREELEQVNGAGTTGYSPCRNYHTLYCTVGGGRGICD